LWKPEWVRLVLAGGGGALACVVHGDGIWSCAV
jgi:hypothetical protein